MRIVFILNSLYVLVFLAFLNPHISHALPSAKITVNVVDEDGAPIEGAEADFGFTFKAKKGWGLDVEVVRKPTDSKGRASASGETGNDLSYGATKNGWYVSANGYHFSKAALGRWEPWNPEVTLVLRKIENPVPMYARRAQIELPVIGEDAGFDLIEYDWVPPYGHGSYADVIFNLEKKYKDHTEFDLVLTVKMPEQYSGIQIYKQNLKGGSEFKLPRNAPESGYLDSFVFRRARKDRKTVNSGFEEDDNYIFRTRVVAQDEKIIKAMYGKIYKPFKFGAITNERFGVQFTYWLNPDYTRNLEYDPKKNLFKGKIRSYETPGLN